VGYWRGRPGYFRARFSDEVIVRSVENMLEGKWTLGRRSVGKLVDQARVEGWCCSHEHSGPWFPRPRLIQKR
jgi:hypothetical protein